MAPNTGVVSEGSKSQSPIMPPQFSSLYSPQNPNSSVGIAMLFPVSHNESRFEAEKQFVETKTNRQHRTDFLPQLVSRPSFNSSISYPNQCRGADDWPVPLPVNGIFAA